MSRVRKRQFDEAQGKTKTEKEDRERETTRNPKRFSWLKRDETE